MDESGAPYDPADLHAARDQLAAVLASVDEGATKAEPQERAYLAGTLDALERIAGTRADGRR